MKTDAHSLKGHGYLVSILSVFLLALPPLKSAKGDPIVLACIAIGAILSILGMALRWIADRKTQRKIERARNEAEGAENRPAGAAAGH
jgi:regulator of protease activity HflC (stomatin/prohibitin superfamily)